MEIGKSDIVLSVAGRDQGKLFYVLETDGAYVLVANGRERRLERPKRKKHEYQEATEYKKYVENTRILKPEYFEKSLELQHSMREQKMASYILLKLKYGNMTIEDADEALDRCIRENDIRGISPEGELYLILTQADDKALPVILERLKRNGFEGKVLDVPVGKETAGVES